MRKSNWKLKLLIAIAVLAGIAAGAVAAWYINAIRPTFTGLAFFGTLTIVTVVIVVVGRKLGIGRE